MTSADQDQPIRPSAQAFPTLAFPTLAFPTPVLSTPVLSTPVLSSGAAVTDHRPGPAYQPVLATLAYAVDRATNRVLLIFKDSGQGDTTLTKYNGVGGKLEPGENVMAGMRREFTEETGLEATRYRLRGTVSWPGFGANGESWFGFVFRVDEWAGQLIQRPAEGQVGWFDLDRLLNLELPLWPGDRYFLPLVFDDTVEQFHGVLPYENGQPVDWQVDIVPAARA